MVLVAICALKAVRARHLLASALWLAGVSASVTLMLYLLGAYEIAVIELSLSLGLVTVLLVFAISMVGANLPDAPLNKRRDWLLIVPALLCLAALVLPAILEPLESSEDGFMTVLWEQRQIDVLAQIFLVFVGVLGVLRLLLPEAARRSRSAESAEPEYDMSTKEKTR
jgi:NADH:ubiquinone oxidoreductase subunit 6 (subunit J)